MLYPFKLGKYLDKRGRPRFVGCPEALKGTQTLDDKSIEYVSK